ncbi:MAG: M50 family metallopeptidase [Chloroflexota bacterium]
MTLFILSLVSFLIVIAVLILAHELGHFITARARGVKVIEFGIGFPPRLFGIKAGGTIYSINAIPLGGFTKMVGEEDPKEPGSLAGKGFGTRLLVLSAGSIMNLLLPLLLFSVAFMVPHDVTVGQVVITEVAPASPAANAGLQPGDILLSLNGREVTSGFDLSRYIQLNLGRPVTLLIQRGPITEKVRLIPRWKPPAGEGAIGVVIDMTDVTTVHQREPFWRAIPAGVTTCFETFVLFKNGIESMIIGAIPASVTGPVGIAQLTGEVARTGVSPLLEFAAFLSINLGILNLFPLPALDGGRIAFVLLEWIRRGKRISPKTEGRIHFIGFALLIAFTVAITYQDIIRIIGGDSLIP